MHNEALSAQREPWISHTDVNLKMRKKRVMVPLRRFRRPLPPLQWKKNTPRTNFRFVRVFFFFLAENFSALTVILSCET